MDTLIQYLQQILAWLLQFVDWATDEVYMLLLNGLIAILNLIPVPAWLQNIGNAYAALPAGVLYFAQALDLTFAMQVTVSAYVVRFSIRRLPFVG